MLTIIFEWVTTKTKSKKSSTFLLRNIPFTYTFEMPQSNKTCLMCVCRKYVVSVNMLVLSLSRFLFFHFTFIQIFCSVAFLRAFTCTSCTIDNRMIVTMLSLLCVLCTETFICVCSHTFHFLSLSLSTRVPSSSLQTENLLLITFHTWYVLSCLFYGKCEFFFPF